MVRPEWSFINMALCAVVGLLVMLPVIVYGVSTTFMSVQVPGMYLYVSWALSGVIAMTIIYLVYKLTIKNAEKSIFTSKE